MPLFTALKDVLTPYAEKIKNISLHISFLKNGEISLDGTVIKGLYPVNSGTMSDSSTSARTAVFSVEPNTDYYVSWLPGSDKYRIAFGNTEASLLTNGTPIYDYIDANTLSHDHLQVHNNDYSYMYVYIGSSVNATINAVSVSTKLLSSYKDEIDDVSYRVDDISHFISFLKNGEISLDGTVIKGLYPVNSGTMSDSSTSARTAVFSVEPNTDYYVSWLPGSDKYRIAFGNTEASLLTNGTPIYDYIDANTLSHDHLQVHNNDYSYMYVYIGSSVNATINAVSVIKKIPSIIDDCLAQDNSIW